MPIVALNPGALNVNDYSWPCWRGGLLFPGMLPGRLPAGIFSQMQLSYTCVRDVACSRSHILHCCALLLQVARLSHVGAVTLSYGRALPILASCIVTQRTSAGPQCWGGGGGRRPWPLPENAAVQASWHPALSLQLAVRVLQYTMAPYCRHPRSSPGCCATQATQGRGAAGVNNNLHTWV